MSDDRPEHTLDLDQTLNEMRDENVPEAELSAARARVWQRLTGSPQINCAAFLPELDQYLAGSLPDARRLLLEDHLGRCADCRRVLAQKKGEHQVFVMPQKAPRRTPAWTKWAIAAGLAVVGLALGRERIDSALAPSGPRATVESIQGALYRVAQGKITAGSPLGERETIRTGPGSRAVLRMQDGSAIELNERTELAIHSAWSGSTILLERGDVIVEAAKQRRGSLKVVARDSVASVKGTIFAVSSGTSGSLVSVVEGSVQVKQPGGEHLLKPGQVAASDPSAGDVTARETIAWSAHASKYLLLAEFAEIERKVAAMPSPALRTQSQLLPLVPANLAVYAAIPNLDGTLRQLRQVIEERAIDSPVLKTWWEGPEGQELRRALEWVQRVTPLLGDEIVFALAIDPASSGQESKFPAVLAEVQPGRQGALRDAIAQIPADASSHLAYQLTGTLLVVSDSPGDLARFTSQMGTGASSPFAVEIQQHYNRGAGWLVGVNLTHSRLAEEMESPEAFTAANVKYLFLEQRAQNGEADNELALSFKSARSGVASWLAAPASAGSADYISSDAVLAVSASTRNPRQAFDEFLTTAGKAIPNLVDDLRRFESEAGLSLANDIAGAFGTDFTIAVERPTLPIPAWVGSIEILNPALLDMTVRRLVDTANRKLPPDHPRITLTQETVNGVVWNVLSGGGGIPPIHWTYDRGYVIVSTDRATAVQAIATRNGGFPLVRSMAFRQQLPGSGAIHYSGFFWLNTGGALSGLAPLLPGGAFQTLLQKRDPVLVIVNGETERIQAASRTRLTSLILDMLMAHGSAASGAASDSTKQPTAKL